MAAPLARRQPLLLQVAGGYGGGRVAAEQDELAAAREQRLDARPREIDDLRRRTVAVRYVGVVAQIEKGLVGEAVDERAQHRQSAEA